ncbi:oxidoreductase [Dyella silvatica]|uniref:oxidoreductase n=1 Tax=Dyella silvatica TaxID=2992128 RepID=UPI0022552B51|nr:oxidoreductase [Dyella silvatica]
MAAPTRIALIGYGFVGKTFHAPLIAAVDGLELTVVASRDADKVHADLPAVEVIADAYRAVADEHVDLVVIASPNDTHAPLARAALEAGKHVVVDKPFTLDLAAARELAALAARHGRVLSVFQNRRWDSDYLGVRQVIEQGLLGRLAHVESHFDRFRPEPRVRWRESAGAGGGLWYDLGPHLIDQALQLFGLPQRIQAHMAIQRDGGQATDWAQVLLDYGSLRVILHASMLVAGGGARFILHGSRGSLLKPLADRQEAQLLAGVRPGAAGWGEDPDDMLFYDGSGQVSRLPTPAGDQRRYYAMLRDALCGQGANPVSPLQAITVMAVLEAAIEAATSGRSVTLSLSDEERGAWPHRSAQA